MTNRQKVIKLCPNATLEYNGRALKGMYYIKSMGIIGVGRTASSAWKSAKINLQKADSSKMIQNKEDESNN